MGLVNLWERAMPAIQYSAGRGLGHLTDASSGTKFIFAGMAHSHK